MIIVILQRFLLIVTALFSITCLEHEKSFLSQDTAAIANTIALYGNSLLVTASTDVVQIDVETGIIQRTFRAHQNRIRSFVVTNDSRLITSGFDDMIIVWSLDSASVLKRIWLRATETLIQDMVYRNEQVFAGGLDGKVRQADLGSGRVMKTIGANGFVHSVVEGGDFLYICTPNPPYVFKIFIQTGTLSLGFNGHSATVFSLFLQDDLLYSGSGDSTVICWNANNGAIVRTFLGYSGSIFVAVVYDGALYAAGDSLEILKWNINDGTIIEKLPTEHGSHVLSFAYESQVLFTGSLDTTVIRRNVISGKILSYYTGKNIKLRAVVSWRNFVISGGEVGGIKLWDTSIDSIDPFYVLDVRPVFVNTLYVYENVLYYAGSDAIVRQSNLNDLSSIKIFTGPSSIIASIVADQSYLYSGGLDLDVFQWNVTSGLQTRIFTGHNGDIRSLHVESDRLYSGSDDKTIRVWNTKSSEAIRVFQAIRRVRAILVGDEFISICSAGVIQMFSISSDEGLFFLEERSTCLSIISTGNFVYTGHDDSLIRVRDSDSLGVIEVYQGHADIVMALCFDDSFRLFSTGFDGTIKKWNLASRRVAFSFENRNSSVTSLTTLGNQVFVGARGGTITSYKIDNAMVLMSFARHSNAITSLLAWNGSIYSSGLDGLILKYLPNEEQDISIVYNSNMEPIQDFHITFSNLMAIQADTKILIIGPRNNTSKVKITDIQIPLLCVTATESEVFAGSRSGIVFAWNVETLKLAFELKGHLSQVNNLLLVDDYLFSASDDKTIIKWELNEKISVNVLKRLSSSALGHLGPVKSLASCFGTLFSAGSDLSVRRWNSFTGRHEDVYFGFSKPVTSVLCHNGSVIAGSEDFGVLLYQPNLPQFQASRTASTNQVSTKGKQKLKRIFKGELAETAPNNLIQLLVIAIVIFVISLLTFSAYIFVNKKRSKKNLSPSLLTSTGRETTITITDLQTVVNSVLGVSKHAAYLLESARIAKLEEIAAGGGGKLFLAKIMDSTLREKFGDHVVQKEIYVTNKIMEEAFYQEVGVMIMLSPFPNFCQIIGYTETPLSLVLKYYPEGSLQDWIRKNSCGKEVMSKILREISEALKVMHSHYLAHCDLKPQNILVQVERGIPTCFITDFGITQILSEKVIAAKSFQVINLRGLSIQYASPEALHNFRKKKFANADFTKYDVYSLGCVAYEVITQIPPWK